MGEHLRNGIDGAVNAYFAVLSFYNFICMNTLDWIVLLGTLIGIAAYGTWKTRKAINVQGYFLGDNTLGWGAIGLSVMATQASAITFISTPGQAYESGMGFVQNYFGLPIALIVVSAVFIPIYYKLKVYTAYEFLENRFDLKTRLLAAFLFLIQRGLAAGITIYAPAIILSTALGWNLTYTIIFVGFLVIIYTVSGGTKAVSITQKWQMAVIMLGMFIAFFMIILKFPPDVSFSEAIFVAGKMGKLETVNFSFELNERYTLWSGLTGGFFLALSYFGTDQSQVQRYLGAKSVTESRMGLMFNAMLKIPMQFFILFVGIMVFIFFQFEKHPVLFNAQAVQATEQSEYAEQFTLIKQAHDENYMAKQHQIRVLIDAKKSNNNRMWLEQTELLRLYNESKQIRDEAKELAISAQPSKTAKDSDFVFLSFVMNYLPHGLVGLLLAVIMAAAMSSTASELNALGATTTMDFYKRLIQKNAKEEHYLLASKSITAAWGLVAIGFALIAHMLENLIEAVNILGSLFYGTILGIFVVAFFIKMIKAKAVFIAALVAELLVIICYFYFEERIAYLWLNVIGCLLVVMFSLLFQVFLEKGKTAKSE